MFASHFGSACLPANAAPSAFATSGQGYGTLAIGQDGTIYVPGNDGWLYAFQ